MRSGRAALAAGDRPSWGDSVMVDEEISIERQKLKVAGVYDFSDASA